MKSSRFGNRSILSGSVGRIPTGNCTNISSLTSPASSSTTAATCGSSSIRAGAMSGISSCTNNTTMHQSRLFLDAVVPPSSQPPRGGDSNYQSPRQSWKPHDWSCPSCNSHNFAKRTNCFSCGTIAPESHEMQSDRKNKERINEKREGEWVCGSCGSCNFSFRLMCFICSRPRPASAALKDTEGGGSLSRPQVFKKQYHEVIRVGEAPGGRDASRRPSAERLDLTRTTSIASPHELERGSQGQQLGQPQTQHTRTVIQAVNLDSDASPATKDQDVATTTTTTTKKGKKKKLTSKSKKKVVDESELDNLLSGGASITTTSNPVVNSVPQEIIPSSASGARTSFFDNMGDEPESRNENFHMMTAAENVTSPSRRQMNSQKDPGSLKPGDWLCPRCRSHNFASRHVCFQCSNARPSFLHLKNTSKAYGGKLSEEEIVFSRHLQSQGKSTRPAGAGDEDGPLFACNNGAGREHMNRQSHYGSGQRIHDVEGTIINNTNDKNGDARKAPSSALDVRANHERSILDRIAQFDTTDILSPEILANTEKRDKALIFGTLRGRLLFGDKKFPDLPAYDVSRNDAVVIDAFKVGDWRCAGCGFHNFSVRNTCKGCMTHQNTFPTLEPFPTGEATPAETNHDADGLFTIIHNEEDGKLYVREIARRIGEFATLRLVLTGRINITLKKKEQNMPVKRFNNGTISDSSVGPTTRHSNDSTFIQHSSARPMRGDWWCDKCQFINFAARLHCKNCHEQRSSTVKVHLGKVKQTNTSPSAPESLTTASGSVYIPNPLLSPADQQMRETFRKERGIAPPGEGIKRDNSTNLESMVVSLDSLLDDVLGDGEDN